MDTISQSLTAARYALLSFRRNPAAAFFTVVFPLIFLILFGFIFGDNVFEGVKIINYQVPGILVLSLVSATFVNLAMGTIFRREAGQLKRLRGTPMSPLVYVIGQVLSALVIVMFMTVLVVVLGRVIFGVNFNFETLPIFLVSILLGTATFSALGLALTAIIPSEDAAPAITNAAVFPLYFVSDVFFQSGDDGFIAKIGEVFPIKPLVRALFNSFDPRYEGGLELPWADWGVIAAWGVFGVIVASRFFRWTPSSDRR